MPARAPSKCGQQEASKAGGRRVVELKQGSGEMRQRSGVNPRDSSVFLRQQNAGFAMHGRAGSLNLPVILSIIQACRLCGLFSLVYTPKSVTNQLADKNAPRLPPAGKWVVNDYEYRMATDDGNTDDGNQESVPMSESDDVVGTVLAVPDKWWGFEAVGRDHHPGACVLERPATQEFCLLKGTGAENRRKYHSAEVVIASTDTNGLKKSTLFSLRPWPFRLHKISNLLPDRVMGRLSDDDLRKLQAAMFRLLRAQG